jgi:hypothetical protein
MPLRQPMERQMEEFTELIRQEPLAAAFGAAGLFCQLIWPLFRARKAIIAAQFGVGANYAMQYALLGAWSGAGVAGLGATQSLISFIAGDRPWLRRAAFVFLPAAAAISFATWSGLPSLFALVSVTLTMMGRLQRDTIRLRLFLLAAAPFGMGYDILVGALPALIGGISSATIAATMLAREIQIRRQPRLVLSAL